MLKVTVQYRNHETLHVCKKQTTQEGRGGGRVRETEAGSRLPGITDVGFFCFVASLFPLFQDKENDFPFGLKT